MVTPPKHLLVLDNSYTYDEIQSMGLWSALDVRDAGGYFDFVWNIHTFGCISKREIAQSGLRKEEISRRSVFIEGVVPASDRPGLVYIFSFIRHQVSLLYFLCSLVRRHPIKLIRVGDPLYLGLCGWVISKITGVPLMIRVNGNNEKIRGETGLALYPKLIRSKKLERLIERFIFQRASLIAAPNLDNLEFAVLAGADRNRCHVFPYGNILAEAHFSKPSDRLRESKYAAEMPENLVICVSRLKTLKYVEDALEAFMRSASTFREWTFIIVGDGELRSDMETRIRNSSVSSQIILMPTADQDYLAALYAAAEVFVSPLCGRALSEAALGACALIGYDTDWQPEMISDGHTGVLVPLRDVDELTAGLQKLLGDSDRRRELGRAARHLAIEKFDSAALNKFERSTIKEFLEDLE